MPHRRADRSRKWRRWPVPFGTTVSSSIRLVQDAGTSIPHEALLPIVPSVPGLTFNPPEYSFLWIESVHKAEFKVRADAAFEGRTVRGSIDVRMGAISVAFITVAIPVDVRTADKEPLVPEVSHPYRRIFTSYSHKDTAIVSSSRHSHAEWAIATCATRSPCALARSGTTDSCN